MDTRTSPARLRIEQIQDALRAAGCAAVVIPSSDPHLSEYLPERWQARQWASGFTGSMATLVVTTERAALFADSRYWVQAESQLAGSGIALAVQVEARAQQRLYALRPEPLRELHDWLERYRQLWDARFEALDELIEEMKEEKGHAGRKKRK